GESGDGTSIAPAMGCTLPGRASALSTARKVACADRTGFANPAAMRSILAPHEREELDLGGGDLLRLALPRGVKTPADRRYHVVLNRVAIAWCLYERVAQRDQACLRGIAPEHIAETALAAFELDGGARHRGLAQVERRPVASDATAYHDQSALGRAQLLVAGERRDTIDMSRELGGLALGQHRHHRAPPALQL